MIKCAPRACWRGFSAWEMGEWMLFPSFKEWIMRPSDPLACRAVADGLGLHPMTAAVLVARGAQQGPPGVARVGAARRVDQQAEEADRKSVV